MRVVILIGSIECCVVGPIGPHQDVWEPSDAAWECDRLRQKQESLLKKPAVVELARFRRRLPAYKEKSKILQLISLNKA